MTRKRRKRRTRGTSLEVKQRRVKVSELMLRRLPQIEMASLLDVSQATISKDVRAILQEYEDAIPRNVNRVKGRELAALDQMELQACVEFERTRKVCWLRARLDILERRSKTLGLDAPITVKHDLSELFDKDPRHMTDEELQAAIEATKARQEELLH